MVSGLRFSSFIHLSSFLCMVEDSGSVKLFCKWLSNFSQNLLLKRLSFPHCILLGPLS